MPEPVQKPADNEAGEKSRDCPLKQTHRQQYTPKYGAALGFFSDPIFSLTLRSGVWYNQGVLRRYAPLRSRTRLRARAVKAKRGLVEDRAYKRWVCANHRCLVENRLCCRWVEPHHVGRPRDDHRVVPLCSVHHREGPAAVHVIGRSAFEQRFRISSEAAIAALNQEWECQKQGQSSSTTAAVAAS